MLYPVSLLIKSWRKIKQVYSNIWHQRHQLRMKGNKEKFVLLKIRSYFSGNVLNFPESPLWNTNERRKFRYLLAYLDFDETFFNGWMTLCIKVDQFHFATIYSTVKSKWLVNAARTEIHSARKIPRGRIKRLCYRDLFHLFLSRLVIFRIHEK